MHKLYPAIQPYATHRLRVDETHELHVEECGNPEGLPVLFVHGGPGAGSEEDFLDWGWRYPFFVAFAINVVALFARLRMVATPEPMP